MKRIIAALLLTTFNSLADDITVTASGPYIDVSKVVYTNQTYLGGIDWMGKDDAGKHDIYALRDDDHVIIIEATAVSSNGIENELTSTTRIPTNIIPYTFTLSDITVTVSRSDGRPNDSTK